MLCLSFSIYVRGFEFTKNLILSTVLELGFLQEIYIISEESGLNNAMICTVINSGILERDVVVNISVTDITAEGIAQVHVWGDP